MCEFPVLAFKPTNPLCKVCITGNQIFNNKCTTSKNNLTSKLILFAQVVYSSLNKSCMWEQNILFQNLRYSAIN